MDVNLAVYRNRIGLFNYSRQLENRVPQNFTVQTYKRRKRPTSKSRKLTILCIVLISTIIPSSNLIKNSKKVYKNSSEEYLPLKNSVNTVAKASDPVMSNSFVGQAALPFCTLHLSFHGVQGGWFVAVPPLQPLMVSDCNFYARYTYGNRSNKGLKLSHWNAGSAYLENKTIEIENLISDHHPHLLGISEANLHKNHCIENCKVEGYDLITCNTLNNEKISMSRVVVYKHTSLVAKVREDLMSDCFSSIWLEVGFPGKSKILVCNLYREWQYMGQADNSSSSIPEQMARWVVFLQQWEKALESGKEVVVLGDFNLDFLTFQSPNFVASSQAYRLKPLVEEMFERVAPYGVKQCVVGATRQGRVGQPDSGLDHFWTNTPGKMSQIYTRYNGSDHKVIMGSDFRRF